MTLRTVLVLLLALVCGTSAAFVISQLRRGNIGPTAETLPVLTAKADVTRGTPLSPELVVVRQYPTPHVPDGALCSLDELAGRVVLHPLSKGLPIVQGQLTPKDGGRGLASMIPAGMRAFTISTPHVAAGVGGFIQPGDKVDVLLTTTSSGPDDTTGGGVTTTLLQNLQVLAVEQRLDVLDGQKDGKGRSNPNDVKCVTLVVTPDQAAKLDLGMNRGLLHLALRNPNDDRDARTLPATMAQLRFYQGMPNLTALGAQLAGFASRVATAMASGAMERPTVAAKEAPKAAPRPEPPPSTEIWTLRGSQGNKVLVNLRRAG
jgi:pilus assembly protein CpaB